MRWFDYLALTAIIVAATAQFLTGSDGTAPPSETPRRPAPQQFAEQQDNMFGNTETEPRLPHPSVPQNSVPDLGQGVVEEKSARTASTGSAFPILSDGTWLTARHVAQDCKKISLRLGNYAVPVSRRVLHPFADIAILKTKAAITPFPFASGSAPLGTAYHIGFPKGRPGVVASGFLGEMTLWHKGRHNYRERVRVWAERVRYPQRQGSLGGLSGGTVLDPDGRIIGVVQAESPRRGRIMTGMPERVSEIAGFAAITLPASRCPRHTDRTRKIRRNGICANQWLPYRQSPVPRLNRKRRIKSPRQHRLKRRLIWLAAAQGNAMHHPLVPVIVINRVMLHRAIVPKRN